MTLLNCIYLSISFSWHEVINNLDHMFRLNCPFTLNRPCHCPPCLYITWGMNNRPTAGHSSETSSHPINMKNMTLPTHTLMEWWFQREADLRCLLMDKTYLILNVYDGNMFVKVQCWNIMVW
jgi:hypothetical protein